MGSRSEWNSKSGSSRLASGCARAQLVTSATDALAEVGRHADAGGEALESEMRHETAASFAIEEGGAGGHRIGPRLTARVAQNGRGPAVSGPVTGTVPPLHRTNAPPADASSGKTPVPVLRRSPACFCYRHQAAVRFPLKCSRAIWLAVGKALRCFLPRRWMLKNRGFSGFATAASSGEERYPRAASSSTLRGSSST